MVQKENELEQFIQTAPWLGFLPGNDGQIKQTSSGDSPVVNLFKSATTAITSNNNCSIPSYFNTMSKQAEAAGKYKLIHFSFPVSYSIRGPQILFSNGSYGFIMLITILFYEIL